MKPVVLIILRHYLPGYKSGGPVRSIANMVEQLGDDFDFKILTLDRDALDKTPYQGIGNNTWEKVGKARVYYVDLKIWGISYVTRIIKATYHDILYLNSFFDPKFAGLILLAKRLKIIPDKPIILAPRGEFSKGALELKSWKKRPYILLSKLIGLYDNLIWQASSKYEHQDIKTNFKVADEKIFIAQNVPSQFHIENKIKTSDFSKENKSLKVVFISRISPKKNIIYALDVLKNVKCSVQFRIFGPIRDDDYWLKCKNIIYSMPDNINVKYCGTIEHSKVAEVFAEHDLFFFPTFGENFGHVIAESLSVGTPVLTSNTTPWRSLEEDGLGWDVSLETKNKFVQAIEELAKMDIAIRSQQRKHIIKKINEKIFNPQIIENNRELFLNAL